MLARSQLITHTNYMIETLLQWLQNIAEGISLEVFVVVGSFLEEIIAPIPSPFVMTTASVIARQQDYTLVGLGLIVILAAVAKTFSSYVVYVAVDKAEDVVLGKFGKYVGISHAQVEKIGRVLSGSWWDDVVLFIARALPIVPTFPISVAAGVIKYDVRSYLLATLLGTIVKNIFYLWIGYHGYTQLEKVWQSISEHPLLVAGAVVVLVVAVLVGLKLKDQIYEKVLHSAAERKRV